MRFKKQNNFLVRDIQKELLIFLKKILVIFENNKINYHLAFGSALGAFRHKGFIPWDDDLDICIIGDDYDKALKILSNEKFNVYSKANCRRFPAYYSKVIDTNYKYIEKSNLVNSTYPQGLFIDLFKIDYIKEKYNKKPAALLIWQKLNYIKNTKKAEFFWNMGHYLAKIFSQKFIDKMSMKKLGKIISLVPTSKCMDVLNDSSHWIYSSKWLIDTQIAKFEDIDVRIPRDIKSYLKTVFGNDFMSIPQENKRRPHCIYFEKLN